MSLSKTMSVPQGVVLAICTIIGSGLLGLPGVAVEEGGAQAAALGWLVTIVLSIPLVLIFLSLSLRVQDAGGVARYASIALGTWAETSVSLILVATFTLCIPIGTYMGSIYIQHIFGLLDSHVPFIAIGVLSLCTAVNLLGVKPAFGVNVASALALVLLVVIMVASRPALVPAGLEAYRDFAVNWRTVDPTQLWTVCAILFWAFLGWENLSFGSEEVKGGEPAIRAVFGFGFAIVTVIYAALAVVSIGAWSTGMQIGGVSGLLGVLEGSPFAIPAHILITLIVVANVNAWVYAASRLVYASGRSGILPRYLGRVGSGSLPRASLGTMLVVYAAITGALAMGMFSVSDGLLMANQNFIVVYACVILCFVKINTTARARLLALCAAAAAVFLISGFRWTLIAPLVLGAVGYFIHASRQALDTRRAADSAGRGKA